jgi:hypothetical protein
MEPIVVDAPTAGRAALSVAAQAAPLKGSAA